MRIAAFGFRSLPSTNGSAGADKFAEELLPRLVERGHEVIAYNRKYKNAYAELVDYKGVKVKMFSTVERQGLDTLVHSFQCTLDIILHNTADVVHIQNGGNSIWSIPLRLLGKKVFISQDGVDWKRKKWPWYGRIYLLFSSYVSVYFSTQIIFDNVIAKRLFEERFKKRFKYIPFGSEVVEPQEDDTILERYNLERNGYFLFVGRFIPDKGLHYLIPAFIKSISNKKLVLVGGSPNPSSYESRLRGEANENVVFAGYVYGNDVTRLIKACFCYIQPSDIEGLSPVVLSVMGLGVPLIVSDIAENEYAVEDTAIKFRHGDIDSLTEKINYAENNYDSIKVLAEKARVRALKEFSWDRVADEHIKVFS
jgi:glycosyltransferase involved in cell wall biosynthesis